MLILDMGSGHSCKNDHRVVDKMIESIVEAVGLRTDIVLKWQLFTDEPPNLPLLPEIFAYAYDLHLYQTTASVFDKESLAFLNTFPVPFIKIACRPELYELGNWADVPVYTSMSNGAHMVPDRVCMCCVPEYPARLEDYEDRFTPKQLSYAVSDHTVGWELYRKHRPEIIEKHFVLERDPNNPDAGPFAITPKELEEFFDD